MTLSKRSEIRTYFLRGSAVVLNVIDCDVASSVSCQQVLVIWTAVQG